jgi:tRNA-dihydrouridine synthase
MGKASRMAYALAKPDFIDINMGCPWARWSKAATARR